MDKIPLINPNLVKVVTAQAERTSTPILRAEVISSEPVKTEQKLSSSKEDLQYKIVLKIGQQQLETISPENLKKGSQIEVKVAPGPELKIVQDPQSKTATPPKADFPNLQLPAQAAMQQLLADRIPNIQSQGLSKLIDQLSQIITGTRSPAIAGKAENLLPEALLTGSRQSSKQNSTAERVMTQGPSIQTAKQTLAHLAYQALAKNLEPSANANTKADPNTSIPSSIEGNLTKEGLNKSNLTGINSPQSATPLQQVKSWLQQLPNSQDISNSAGLRNALNNTGIRAETQLSQLAQQFSTLSKGSPSSHSTQNSGIEKSANAIFQQLQKIQQKIFSQSSTLLPKTDLSSIVKNTAQSLENGSQAIVTKLKSSPLNTKTESSASILADNRVHSTTTKLAAANPAAISASAVNSSAISQAANNWQNPLLNSQVYSTLNGLMQDPVLQHPSSNNKLALGQILNQLAGQADTRVQIPLNWPERNGNDAILLRTLQNILGHIEREQGIQLQQSDNNLANSLNQPSSQNQQWLPLLIHHQQQLQLIEFFINKEEKENTQGEKKNHWFINLHFDLPQLGELGIEIAMFENECSTTFWSESSSTLSQLSHHVQPLRQRLTEQGIIVSDVQSRHGTLVKRKHNIEQRLVDIKT